MGSIPTRRRLALGAGLLAAALTAAIALVPLLTGTASADTAPVTVLSSDFEDGTAQGWAPRGTAEVVANSTTVAHGGTHSLSVTGRKASWNGPAHDLLSIAQQGVRYTFSVWVRLASTESSTPMRLSIERQLAGTANYDTVVNNVTVANSGWTQLTGSYTLANSVDVLKVYVESVSGTPSFFIDDFTMTYVPATPIQTDLPALKDVFGSQFTMGAAVSPATLLGEHGQLLTKHFGSVTPGNALKWDATEKTENSFTYTDADTIVNYAVANGLKIRGHTLVWHNQVPSWVFLDANGAAMTATAANKTLLLSRLQNHITNVMGRYKGEIGVWDVANEVLNDDGTLRNSTWYQIAGLDYIRTAFTTAHQVDPSAELCINDYNLTVAAKRDGMYNLVSQLRGEGIPIDCIGSQMHSNISWPSVSDTTSMIQKFAGLGVDQQITEMDVSIYTDNSSSYPTVPASALTSQAAEYKALFGVFTAYQQDISSVTLWGLADDDTWLDSYPISRLDAPLLFDQQLQAKPAYWSIIGSASPTGSVSPSKSSASPSASSVSPSASRSASASASASKSASASASASASRSASTSPSASAAGGCSAVYTVTNQWPGGFQGDLKVTNTGAALTSWTIGWSFTGGQQLSQLWNGTATQSGANVSVANMSWNGGLATNATVDLGFLASWTGSNPAPTTVTLNGRSCTLS